VEQRRAGSRPMTTLAPVVPAPASAPAPLGRTGRGSIAGVVAKRLGQSLLIVAVSLGVLVGAWWAGLKIFSINPLVGKTPADVWNYFFNAHPHLGVRPQSLTAAQARSEALHGLLTTLGDAALGFVIGMVVALAIASLFVLFEPFEFAFMPIAMLLRSVPLVALTPIILLIFKGTDLRVAVIGGIVVLFPALVNIVFGLRSASAQASDLVMAYGGSQATVVRKVALPTALPAIFAAARISVPGSLIGALVAEWLSTGKGIGGTILNAIGGFEYNYVWASIAILTGVSLLLYTAVGVIESLVLTSFGFHDGS
jgi:ABC-type nitrate/sulfonate/bicarbonate transport system permease component